MVTFYCKKTCRTCQKARKWLEEKGVLYRFVDYIKEPPPPELVRRILAEYGDGALRHRHPKAKELKGQAPEALAQAIAADPNLLIRPILVFDDGSYAVGFDPEYWERLFAA